MRKVIPVILDDKQIVELYRILIDNDVEGALIFVKANFKGKVRELLEGG